MPGEILNCNICGNGPCDYAAKFADLNRRKTGVSKLPQGDERDAQQEEIDSEEAGTLADAQDSACMEYN